jgi:hypothetical protein
MGWAVCFALGTLVAGAQTPEGVFGRVLDATTGLPVPEVRVELELSDRSLFAVTDSEGRFRLQGVPQGRHDLWVRHLAYGELHHPIEMGRSGHAAVEVTVSPTAIELEPLVVDAERTGHFEGRASPSSRNIVTRAQIEQAEANTLVEFLARGRFMGLRVRDSHQVGGTACVEFRPDVSAALGFCRFPQVFLDGIPTHPDVLRTISLTQLQRIQVVPPSEAGARYGARSGYGAILLQTRRGALASPAFPDVQPRSRIQPGFDWSTEPRPYPWGRVYAAAVAGNAVGLAAGMAILSQCMDMERRRIYRNEDHCGAPMLLGSGLAIVTLPALGGSLAARRVGSTDQSRGSLRYSTLAAHVVFVPGYALVSMTNDEGGLTGPQVAGMALVVAGAPLLNTLADRLFRHTH